jgi:hypothetical protein
LGCWLLAAAGLGWAGLLAQAGRRAWRCRFAQSKLAALLCCAVQVKGKRLDTEGGIRTRARAAAQAEQWSAVPLRVKIVMLLTDSYIESTTQGGRRAVGTCRGRQQAASC